MVFPPSPSPQSCPVHVKLIFVFTSHTSHTTHTTSQPSPGWSLPAPPVCHRTMENAIKSSLIDCLANVCKLKIRSQHRWCFAFQHRNIKTFWTHSSPLLSAIYIPAVYVVYVIHGTGREKISQSCPPPPQCCQAPLIWPLLYLSLVRK